LRKTRLIPLVFIILNKISYVNRTLTIFLAGIAILNGFLSFAQDNAQKAISYEKDIERAPANPDNYLKAAELYCHSEEEVWGVIYGEIFMNLEPASARSTEMSKLLYNTYAKALTKTNETSLSVSFTKEGNNVDAEELKKEKPRMPFSAFIYEPLIGTGAAMVKALDYEGFCEMRTIFLDQYYEKGYEKDYPNVLFQYQKKVQVAGHLDAYNHWLLREGDLKGFAAWKSGHLAELKAFENWQKNNRMVINSGNLFLRTKA
jgi:hypothetical protein